MFLSVKIHHQSEKERIAIGIKTGLEPQPYVLILPIGVFLLDSVGVSHNYTPDMLRELNVVVHHRETDQGFKAFYSQ